MDLLSNLPSSSPLLHVPSSSPSPKSRVRVSQNLLPIRRKPSLYFPISSQNRRRMEAPTTVRCSSQAGDNGSPTGCRIGEVARVTKETDVQVRLNLDGTGIADSSTGIPFLDHMLDQLASHGLFDVHVKARGDIHIDDHHTNEDVALAIGTTLLKALGDRKGINRFGDFTAPLDEALVHVALDLSGRPHLSYDIDIPTERVGTYDTQLVEHFFQSLVNTSGMTLHIRQLAGRNSHHIIEATFKAFARALRQATEYDVRRRGTVPSVDMCSNNEFLEVNGISNLDKMVEAKRDILYPLIYLLSTTLFKGCFLLCIPYIIDCNEMEDKCMNDCLYYIHQERHYIKINMRC